MAEQQPVALPRDVQELVLHENFWWFFQSPPHQQRVLSTLTDPSAIRTLLKAAFHPTDTGLGLGAAEPGARTAVFADGPVKYVNMTPGHGAATYLVTLGQGSESHRLAFSACQVLLTPPLQAALLADDALLTELFRFVALPSPLPTARAGYFTNLVYQLLETDPGRVAAWIARGSILPKLLEHVDNDSIQRLLCHRIDEVVPIGGKPAAGGGTRWLGLLSGGPMLPMLRAEGVDLATVLLEQLRRHSGCEQLAATTADACESWAATAAKGPASTEGVMHASIAVELLGTLHSELSATALLSVLRGSQGDVSSDALYAVLPLLSSLVKVENTLEGSSHAIAWETTPLRTQLRSVLSLLAGWLKPGSGDESKLQSWCSGVPRVGRLRHRVAGLLARLCEVECDSFPARGLQEATLDGVELANSGALAAMVEALFAFPTASVLHASLAGGLRHIIRNRDATTEALFRDLELTQPIAGRGHGGSGIVRGGGLLSTMVRVYTERPNAQKCRPPPQYYGHLEQLMTLARECRSIVSGCEAWEVLCAAESAPLNVEAQLEAVEEPLVHAAENATGGVYKRYPHMQLHHEKMIAGKCRATRTGDILAAHNSNVIDNPRVEEANAGETLLSCEAADQQPEEKIPDHAMFEIDPNRCSELQGQSLPPGLHGPGKFPQDDDDQWEATATTARPLDYKSVADNAAAATAANSDLTSSPSLYPSNATTAVPKIGSGESCGLRDSLTGDLMSLGQPHRTQKENSGETAAENITSTTLRAGAEYGSPILAPLEARSEADDSLSTSGSVTSVGALPPLVLPPVQLGLTGPIKAALPPPRLAPLDETAPSMDKGTKANLESAPADSMRVPDSATATSTRLDKSEEEEQEEEQEETDGSVSPSPIDNGPVDDRSNCDGQTGRQDTDATEASIEAPKSNAQKQTRFCTVQ